MSETRKPVMTGGCQCGAVRYAAYETPDNTHICHCRMCQKAFGSFFAPLCNVNIADFAVTRGEITEFKSSEEVRRGFCARCGTPLTFLTEGSDHYNVSIGSFDEPSLLKPKIQIGIEARMPWFSSLPGLPEDTTDSAGEKYDFSEELALIARTNRQHPDHDTDTWPPEIDRDTPEEG